MLGSCGVKENEAVVVTATDLVTDAPTELFADASGLPVSASKGAYQPAPAESAKSVAPSNITKAYVRESAVSQCTSEYPDDLAMRAACKRNAEAGAASFAEIADRYWDSSDMQSALAGCLRDYTENGITDFSLVGGCARNNENGLKSMKE